MAVNQPSDLADDAGLDNAEILARFHAAHDGKNIEEQTVLAPVSGSTFEPTQYHDPPALGEYTDIVSRDWTANHETNESTPSDGMNRTEP